MAWGPARGVESDQGALEWMLGTERWQDLQLSVARHMQQCMIAGMQLPSVAG